MKRRKEVAAVLSKIADRIDPTLRALDETGLSNSLAGIALSYQDQPDRFEQEFRRKLQEALFAAALLFYWVDIMGADQAIQSILQGQQVYLDDFVKDLPTLSQKQAVARARLYATSLGKFVVQLQLQSQPDKMLVWHYSPEARHCQDCKDLDGVARPAHEWYRLGLYPRSGETQCLMNCKCRLEEM